MNNGPVKDAASTLPDGSAVGAGPSLSLRQTQAMFEEAIDAAEEELSAREYRRLLEWLSQAALRRRLELTP